MSAPAPVTAGFAIAIAGAVGAVAFMLFAAPGTGPQEVQGAPAAASDDESPLEAPELELPHSSSSSSTASLPLPQPSLPLP